MCERDKQTATENIRCKVLIVSEKTQKNLKGGWREKHRETSEGDWHQPPPPFALPRVKNLTI